MIRAYLKGEQTDWDINLGCLAAAYRATPHESTGLTPNLLMLGKEVRLPAELMFGSVFNGQNRIETYGEYVEILKERMLRAHSVVRKHLQAADKRQKDNYDAKCRSEYDLNSHTRGYTKHVREVQTLQKNGQTYNERNYLKKASVANIFEDGRDIVKQSYAESQKHWASRAGIRIKSFPKPTKPSLSKYTATAISVAPKPLAPLETSTATCTAASIDSYTRLF
ncbi:unnamed protein product [Mytilus coruscus]|uniref:Integrase catalytic domain-containing protein n=1 Tax=Mytilus coruscus TaxID=42192 RepID=A0A6J8B589_MYTCO|nr:unnamed protein product [Mytilus coruscus]